MTARSSHFDALGRAHMIDVGTKPVTAREAVARGYVEMSDAAFRAISDGSVAKGDVLGIARIAGIQAAKRTADWIPLAHPLPIESIEIHFELETATAPMQPRVAIEASVRITAKTGVEMEALVAVSAAALCIYDMCKSIDREMTIQHVQLVRKSGGKSGPYDRSASRR